MPSSCKRHIMKKLAGLWVSNFIFLFMAYTQPIVIADSVSVADTAILPGDYALVAGGSKGIGYAIAEALARRKYNLILIARHLDSLESAKRKLESAYHIHVELLVNDLSREEAADEIAQWCIAKNIRLKMLCNVAGAGGERDYLSLSLDSLRYMVRLNVESCLAPSLKLLPLLEKNAPSYILNVAVWLVLLLFR